MGNRILEILSAWKYTGLIFFILLFFLLAPLIPDIPASRLILPVIFISAIILLEYVLGLKRQVLMLSIGTAIVSVMVPIWGAVRGVSLQTMSHSLVVFDLTCNTLFYAIAIFGILKKVFSEKKVTQDTIAGGISIYFLLGIFWAMLYRFVLILDPGAFSVPVNVLKGFRLFYFSFTTLTTLGFGDVTPVNQMASVFVVLEAAIGQIFLTVFIARLVGLHVTHSHHSEAP